MMPIHKCRYKFDEHDESYHPMVCEKCARELSAKRGFGYIFGRTTWKYEDYTTCAAWKNLHRHFCKNTGVKYEKDVPLSH